MFTDTGEHLETGMSGATPTCQLSGKGQTETIFFWEPVLIIFCSR